MSCRLPAVPPLLMIRNATHPILASCSTEGRNLLPVEPPLLMFEVEERAVSMVLRRIWRKTVQERRSGTRAASHFAAAETA